MTRKNNSRYKLFKTLCYAENLQNEYARCINDGILSPQEFNTSFLEKGIYIHKKFYPSIFCKSCGKPVSKDEFQINSSYWYNIWFTIHTSCALLYEKHEKFECQKIDANCNDCQFFKRVKNNNGTCLKFNKSVLAQALFCSNLDCFVHRDI